ncbi:uncharacterized protein LOC121255158 [Juglans microcarpa x Juglans regia]|uniref:uncharacterized protein LOC121255158 n=1 Tax=Juglans microcarpa x Juglans regia TaxID=2249226 RepID=UPI001B7DA026|nr:uncharacterized protein LOC121255158 [Juglans microcarpa x Juglans regia]
MEAFREVLMDCSLQDVGFYGPKYTWSNGREGDEVISERLDRFLGNNSFFGLFPYVVVKHGVAAHSDHLPIWFDSKGSFVEGRRKKQFIFEVMWVGEKKCSDIIENVWVDGDRDESNNMEGVMKRITTCGKQLASWNKRSFGHVQKKKNEAGKNWKRCKQQMWNNLIQWACQKLERICNYVWNGRK